MKKFGAFLVEDESYNGHMKPLGDDALSGTETRDDGTITRDGAPVGISVNGQAVAGFACPDGCRLDDYTWVHGTMAMTS